MVHFSNLKTRRRNGNTGISTRLLDHIPYNLFIIPLQVTSSSIWFGPNVKAVVCRVSVPYALLKLAYVNGMNDIDGVGNKIVPVPPITTNVQYPYYANDEYLLELKEELNLNLRFNKLKYISCQKAA